MSLTIKVHALNGSGRAPQQLTTERVLQDCPSSAETLNIPITHAHAVTVPGTVAGWVDAVEKWGSMSMKAILGPSIELAEQGFPVSPITAYHWDCGLVLVTTRSSSTECISFDQDRMRMNCLWTIEPR